jgi:DNA-binding transcriptional regulator YiaG
LIVAKKEQKIEDLREETRQAVEKKDEEIKQLRTKIEEMSSEFARMLKETLEKMQERIELAQWDNNENEVHMLRRLKDITSNNNG